MTGYGKIIVFILYLLFLSLTDIKPMVSLLLKQNRAIMERMDRLEELVANQQTFAVKSGKEKINILNDVRVSVSVIKKILTMLLNISWVKRDLY